MSLVKKLFLFFLSILCCLLLLEIFSQFYLQRQLNENYKSRLQILSSKVHAESWHLRLTPSPYFGYVCGSTEDSTPLSALCNNYGFSDINDFPYIKKNKNELVIGIFGGSVAENLGYYVSQQKNNFSKEISSIFKNRTPIFLNFARGGYRSWQTFYILSYFLNSLDVIIVLDGQNEIRPQYTTKTLPDHPILMQKFFSTSIKFKILSFFSDMVGKTLLRSYTFLRIHDLFEKSDFLILLYQSFYYLLNSIVESILRGQPHSANQTDVNFENQQSDLLRRWFQSIQNSRNLVLSQNKKYLHFVQPSPYFSDIKPMSDTEKFLTLKSHPFKIADWRRGQLNTRSLFYKSHIAPFVTESQSLETLFDSHPEEIYIDDCCHINDTGNRIVFLKILEELKKVL